MNKFLKIALWVVGVPTALLLLIMLLSPIATPVINNHGQDFIGRDLSVKSVFVNPFFGTVTIKDFHCKEADEMVDFVAFDRLHVQINWLALMGKHANLRHIHLDNFAGEILNDTDSFNFSDIIERFASKDTTVQDTTPSKWTVSLRDIRLHNGQLLYHDVVRDNKWFVDSVNLHIPGLYFGRQQSNAGAGYVMASRRYALTLKLDEVNTNVALPIVQDYLKVSNLGALITGSIHIDGSLENISDLVASGDLSMTGLDIRDEKHNPIAGWDELRLVIRRGDVATNTYNIDTLAISGITGAFERTTKGNTVSLLLRKPEEHPATPADTLGRDAINSVSQETSSETVSAPLTWSADYLSVTAHDLRFVDKSMRKSFKYAIDTLTLSGKDIVSHGKNTLQLSARLSDGGKLNATYTGGLDLKVGQNHVSTKLTGVQIKGFTPFTEYYFACPVTNGELAVQFEGTINSGKLNSSTMITVDQPEIGAKARNSKAKYKDIPLKMGVDMLKSAQNIVVLEVPVQGDINSPKFKLGKVIGRAFAKVFFGPLMGARDNRKLISEDEMEEMLDILGTDTAGIFFCKYICIFKKNVVPLPCQI